MNISQLRSFLLVADLGSMTRAAQESFVDLSALSRRISQLERELGIALFVRVGKSTALTDEGRAVLPRIREALAQLDAMVSATATAVTDSVFSILLPSQVSLEVRAYLAAAAARIRNSGIRFVPARNEQIWERLRAGEAIFAIVHSGAAVPDGQPIGGASYIELANDRLLVAANARAVADLPDHVHLRDLSGLKYLTSDNATAPTLFGQLNASLGWAGVRTRVELPHHDVSYVAHILATERAFSFVVDDPSDPSARALYEDPDIRILTAVDMKWTLRTQLLWVEDAGGPARDAFLRALVDVIAEKRHGERPDVRSTEPAG